MSSFIIEELTLFGVYDQGIPNLERIVIRVMQEINLADYGLMLGIRAYNGSGIPIRDNMLWFGSGNVMPGDWLFVYTAKGETKITTVPNTSERIISLHWGRPATIFNGPEFMPILFRLDGIQFPPSPPLLIGPQTSGA
ncbi:hypothetical protein [Xanthomonas sacchari]|uniref:hypothetical protein n=1 Tax=Xanthomonas sacchari TaxID=56458 RepID=UPI0022534AC3|nr:hypothetical protein [Xanthomonas sacchari]